MADLTSFQTVSNGDVPKEGYFNGIIDNLPYRIDEQTEDATEYTDVDNSTDWQTLKTYTFTPDSTDDMLLGFKVEYEGKQDSGSNNVTYGAIISQGGDIYYGSGVETISSATYVAGEVFFYTPMALGSTGALGVWQNFGLASYTIGIGHSGANTTDTVYVQKCKITMYWLRKGVNGIVTSSGKFS